jgi:hypothetical protein
MARRTKITTGPNERPVDETISQSGGGLPDDTSGPVEVDEKQAARLEKKLREERRQQQQQQSGEMTNTDAVPPGTPGSGENVCRRCAGTGKVNGETCPECGGSGKVVTAIGGAG